MRQISIVSIDQVNKLSKNEILSQIEMNNIEKFAVKKKRMEYVAGRLACKLAYTKEFGKTVLTDLSVMNDQSEEFKGMPRIFNKGEESGAVSISHSGKLACGGYNREGSFGIDLEKVCSRHNAFIKYSFSEKEKKLIEAFEKFLLDQVSTLFWTAKEAMSKAMMTGLRVDARDFETEQDVERVKKFLEPNQNQITFGGSYKAEKVFEIKTSKVNYEGELYFLTTAITKN